MHPLRIILVILCAISVAACATVGKEPVSLAAEPKTPDEQTVARHLEAIIIANNTRDIETHMAHYAPDAKIYSTTRDAIVSREEWRAIIRESSVKADMRQVKLTTLSPDRIRADAELYILGSRGISSRSFFYEFVRREGQWLIIERRPR